MSGSGNFMYLTWIFKVVGKQFKGSSSVPSSRSIKSSNACLNTII